MCIRESPIANVRVVAKLSRVEVYQGLVVPWQVLGVTDQAGTCQLDLWPNALSELAGSSSYLVTLQLPGNSTEQLRIYVPDTAPADLQSLLVSDSFAPQAITGPVRSVEGTVPDDAGNVPSLLGNGHALSYYAADLDTLHTRLADARLHGRLVASTATPTQVAAAVEQLLPEQAAGSPTGRGQRVLLPSGLLLTRPMALSTMVALDGVLKGVSTLQLDAAALVGGSSDAPRTYGHLTVLSDTVKKDNIAPQGHIRDLTIAGSADATPPYTTVHGYYAAGEGIGHTFLDAEFSGHTGDGVHIDGSFNQVCSHRLKSTYNKGRGMYFRGTPDGKHYGLGAGNNVGEQFVAEQCATMVVDGFDMFLPNAGFLGEYTARLIDMARFSLSHGTISGRLCVQGRNDQGTGVRYDVTGNHFLRVDVKLDENLAAMYAATGLGYTYDSFITLEDVDGVEFDSLKLMFNDVQPSAAALAKRPLYGFKITTVSGAQRRRGAVKLVNAGGLVHLRARPDDGLPILAFSRHYASAPELVEWDGFVPGQLEIVPTWAVNAADPDVRTHVAAGGTYDKAQYPMGYLWATLGTGGTLDDAASTFTVPPGPLVSSAYTYAMRVWP